MRKIISKPSILGAALLTAVSGTSLGNEEPDSGNIYLFSFTNILAQNPNIYGTGGLDNAYTFETMEDCLNGAETLQSASDRYIHGYCTNLFRNPDVHERRDFRCDKPAVRFLATCQFILKK